MAIIKIGNPAIDLDAAEIPNLDTAKITTGQFTDSRIADVAATKITGTITPSDSTVSLAKLTATGTKDATTFLRGDNTFASAGGANTPAFFAYTNTNTNISNRTTTKVPLNATIYDSGSIFDTSNNRVTFGVAGKYMLHFGGTFGNTVINDANGLQLYLRKNGSIGLWSQGQTDYNNFTNHVSSVSGSLLVDASATDYYEIYMYIDVNTGTPSISGDATEVRSYMGGYKIIE